MISTPELLSCPFCGESPSLGKDGMWWAVGCGGCGFMSSNYVSEAEDGWNKAPGKPELDRRRPTR